MVHRCHIAAQLRHNAQREMNFNTSAFALFLLVVGGTYAILQSRGAWRLQNLVLLVASYVFYGAWDTRFLFLIFASTALDYTCGLGAAGRRPGLRAVSCLLIGLCAFGVMALAPEIGLDHSLTTSAAKADTGPPLADATLNASGRSTFLGVAAGAALFAFLLALGYSLPQRLHRRFFLMISLSGNLGLLAVFKYFDFFVESLSHVIQQLGGTGLDYTLGLILPVGISFYTFQTLSYTIDIYRGEMEPTDDLIDFSLFVTYFPQLVAGPIERACVLLPQLQRPRVIDAFALQTGAFLIGWGLFKKIFVADNLSPLVERVFATDASPTGPEIWMGSCAFAFQIYCDFSAYSDIARGVSRAMGIELMVNFDVPFAAGNPRDFWRRWHISLSTWLRDYVYIPLGGNRGGPGAAYRNLMLTMLIGGLWHGARSNFVFWGVYQGGLLCLHRLSEPALKRLSPRSPRSHLTWQLICWLIFSQMMIYGWMLFRAEGGNHIVDLSVGLTRGWSEWRNALPLAARVAWFSGLLVVVDLECFRKSNLLAALNWPAPARAMLYCTMFYMVSIFGSFDVVEFIYFQF